MKFTIALLFTLISTQALATRVIIYKGTDRFDQSWSAKYKYNKELSRAWIETEIETADRPPRRDIIRSRPDLLTYNNETHEISYQGTVCAYIEFKQRRRRVKEILRTTENCKLHTTMITEMYDDGYNRYPINYKVMVLDVNDEQE